MQKRQLNCETEMFGELLDRPMAAMPEVDVANISMYSSAQSMSELLTIDKNSIINKIRTIFLGGSLLLTINIRFQRGLE
jgi:hypothetical protein